MYILFSSSTELRIQPSKPKKMKGQRQYTTLWTRSFNLFREHVERGGRGSLVVDAGKKGGSRILITLDLPGERVNHVQPPPRTWKPTGRRKRDAERREAWLCRRRREAWLKRRGECGEQAGTPAYPLVAPASHPVITTTDRALRGLTIDIGVLPCVA